MNPNQVNEEAAFKAAEAMFSRAMSAFGTQANTPAGIMIKALGICLFAMVARQQVEIEMLKSSMRGKKHSPSRSH